MLKTQWIPPHIPPAYVGQYELIVPMPRETWERDRYPIRPMLMGHRMAWWSGAMWLTREGGPALTTPYKAWRGMVPHSNQPFAYPS